MRKTEKDIHKTVKYAAEVASSIGTDEGILQIIVNYV